MLEPRHRWIFPEPVEIAPGLAAEARSAGISTRTLELLARRGLLDAPALRAFLAPPRDALHDPRLLPEAARFIERVSRARTAGEGVLVFGDFDADGISGLATMTLALRAFGVRAEPYIPSRLDEGHGLSLQAVEKAVELDCPIIVTVDTGSTSVAEIAVAVERGIDVLVTDHHRMPPVLPAAYALVNPHRPDSPYPDDRLSGSGVAFKVAQLLLADEPGGPETAIGLAELATIGTVSDVAPVLGENRAIARLGLERMRTAPRAGIAALLARSGLNGRAIDLETVAFAIAPRINAAGRVGDAFDALRLLLTEDRAEADGIADLLEAANLSRRELTKTALKEAEALADAVVSDAPAIVVRGAWPVGIVGLVASRLAEERARPAVVGADIGDLVRASCRSAGGFDLGAALEACHDLLIRHGGHAGAAGFEIEGSRWEEFRARFEGLAAAAVPTDPRGELRLDLALRAEEVDYPLLRELALLAPTGTGNPQPLVAVLGVGIARVRPANGGHTQLTLRRDRDVLDAIAFGRADLADTLHEGDRVDVVATLASRTFGGYESLQLEVRDVAPSGSHAAAAALLDLVVVGAAS
ncbi:MAG TPA: single-stranded-DNA-specific exonuclease RecJ [Candidatus Acidoferrum sp.]|nr:single-stranded-DNA-specific exonuclease RecJ [Candidatus Acidoferrum sp.]